MAYPRQLTLDPGMRAAEQASDQIDHMRRQGRDQAYKQQRAYGESLAATTVSTGLPSTIAWTSGLARVSFWVPDSATLVGLYAEVDAKSSDGASAARLDVNLGTNQASLSSSFIFISTGNISTGFNRIVSVPRSGGFGADWATTGLGSIRMISTRTFTAGLTAGAMNYLALNPGRGSGAGSITYQNVQLWAWVL